MTNPAEPAVRVYARSENGALAAEPGAGAGPAGALLSDFLMADLQGSRASTEEVVRQFQAVRSGSIPSWRRDGNAYVLLIDPDRVVLEDQYPSPNATARVEIGLDAFLEAVGAWSSGLSQLKARG